MWIEHLHPRDEYGRFKLSGKGGYWDKLKGGEANRVHAANIAEWKRNQARQEEFSRKRDAGTLTAAEDAEWDRLAERGTKLVQNLIPRAHFKGLQPHDDGTWRDPDRPGRGAFDDRGAPLGPMLLKGALRVGDRPDGDAGGVWHVPGEYLPGRVPRLRNEWGAPMGQLMPEPNRSVKDRRERGAFARAENRAEAAQSHWRLSRDSEQTLGASPETHGAHMLSPLNPVGRPRVARKQRQRKTSSETWIRRLNAQMEGR